MAVFLLFALIIVLKIEDEMVQLPPSEFTYGKYGNGIIPYFVLEENFVNWLLKQNIIGYCNSMECEIRPRDNEMAIMIEEDNWQGWSHVPIDVWKLYLKAIRGE